MYRFLCQTVIAPLAGFAVVAVFPSIETLASVCLIGGLWGIVALAFIVRNPRANFSISGLLGAITAIQYLIGAAVSLTMWGDQAINVYDYFSTGAVEPVVWAALYVLAYAFALITVGRFEAPYWRPVFADLRDGFEMGLTGVCLIGGFAVLQVVAISLGMHGFSSIVTLTETEEVPMLWGLVAQGAMALPVVLPWAMVSAARNGFWGRFLILAGAAAVNVMWFAMQSRVVFAVAVMLAILSYAWSHSPRVSLRRIVVIAVAAAPVVIGAWLLSSSVRMVSYGENSFAYNERSYRTERENVKDAYEGFNLLRNGSDWVTDYLVQNVALRSFYIGYLRTLMSSRELDPYLYGSDTLTSLAMGVPRAVFPWKRDVLGDSFYTTEWRMNRSFGFEVQDMPDTLATGAYGNFGLAGIFIYPPLVAIFAAALAWLAGNARQPIAKLYIFGLSITLAVIIEVNFTAWVIVFRTCLLVVLISLAVAFFTNTQPGLRKTTATA